MSARFSKLFWTGILFIFLGVISYFAEQVFYGYVDENGLLQESLFLPLAFILGFIGLILLGVGSRKARR